VYASKVFNVKDPKYGAKGDGITGGRAAAALGAYAGCRCLCHEHIACGRCPTASCRTWCAPLLQMTTAAELARASRLHITSSQQA